MFYVIERKIKPDESQILHFRTEILPLIRYLLRTFAYPELLTHASPTEARDMSCCRCWCSRLQGCHNDKIDIGRRHRPLIGPCNPLRFFSTRQAENEFLASNIYCLSNDNAPPRFVLGEVFVGTLSFLFAEAPPCANEVFVGGSFEFFKRHRKRGKAVRWQHPSFGGLRRPRREFQFFFFVLGSCPPRYRSVGHNP